MHWLFRHRFLEISIDPRGAAARGVPVRLWDFLFYGSFGFVVSSSVGILGSILGMYISVLLDLPTGATIVCTFGLVLSVMAAVRPLIRARSGSVVRATA
jgi:zinc/manganese transport system permease protein